MIFSSLQDNSHIFTIFFNSFDGLQFYTDCAFSNNWASLSSSFLSFLPRLFVINWLEGPNLDGTHQTDGSISKNQAWSIWVKDVASVKKIASCDWKNSKVWPPLSGEMRIEKENSDTVKVHFAKIIEKQNKTWTFKTKNYFETLRKVPV